MAPAGSATCGTPIALSVTEIRSTRRGTSGPATGAGICPSTGTKVKSGTGLPLPAAVGVEDARRAAARAGPRCCGSGTPGRSTGCRGHGRCRRSRRAARRNPVPPRPLTLRPRPSARNVVGRWGISPGSTIGSGERGRRRPPGRGSRTPSSGRPGARRTSAGAAVPQARSDLTPLPPDEGEPGQGGRHGVPGAQAVAGVGRRREERRQQGDAGQRRAAVRHPDRVDRERRSGR